MTVESLLPLHGFESKLQKRQSILAAAIWDRASKWHMQPPLNIQDILYPFRTVRCRTCRRSGNGPCQVEHQVAHCELKLAQLFYVPTLVTLFHNSTARAHTQSLQPCPVIAPCSRWIATVIVSDVTGSMFSVCHSNTCQNVSRSQAGGKG